MKRPLIPFPSKGKFVENVWLIRDCTGVTFGEFREDEARKLCNVYNSAELFAELLMSSILYIKQQEDEDASQMIKMIVSALVEFEYLSKEDKMWLESR